MLRKLRTRKLLLSGKLQSEVLPANIRLGWKGLAGTKTIAYYENSYITAVKCLITFDPNVNVMEHFFITDQ